jgi:hypothetical protein
MKGQRRTNWAQWWLAAICAAGALQLSGCAGTPTVDTPGAKVTTIGGGTWVGDEGLDVRVWTLDAAKHAPGVELFTYEPRPVPAPTNVLAAWSRAGLRVLSVPTVELDALRVKLKAIGASRQDWIGQQPRWGVLASGPFQAERREFIGPDGPDVIERGRARLLVRCWSQAAEDETGQPTSVLRIEVAAQVVGEASGLSLTPAPWGEGDGRVLESMTLRMRLRDGDAILIVPERPDVSWAAIAAPAGDAPIEVAGPPSAAPGEASLFVAPTLGELLLTGDIEFGRASGTGRVAIALVPHTRTAATPK